MKLVLSWKFILSITWSDITVPNEFIVTRIEWITGDFQCTTPIWFRYLSALFESHLRCGIIYKHSQIHLIQIKNKPYIYITNNRVHTMQIFTSLTTYSIIFKRLNYISLDDKHIINVHSRINPWVIFQSILVHFNHSM